MERNMKRITGFAVAAGAAMLLAGATVLAQPYGGFGPGSRGAAGPFAGARGPGAGPGMHGGAVNVAERLAARKAELKITAEQEPQWNAFAAAVTGQAGAMQARRESMWQLPQGERFAQREAMRSQHLEQHRVVDAAFDQLYAALTPEQRTLMDQQGCGLGGHGRGRA
jgi:protein CpxP